MQHTRELTCPCCWLQRSGCKVFLPEEVPSPRSLARPCRKNMFMRTKEHKALQCVGREHKRERNNGIEMASHHSQTAFFAKLNMNPLRPDADPPLRMSPAQVSVHTIVMEAKDLNKNKTLQYVGLLKRVWCQKFLFLDSTAHPILMMSKVVDLVYISNYKQHDQAVFDDFTFLFLYRKPGRLNHQ